MLQLAFELTGPKLSAAVLEGDEVRAALFSESPRQHAETLFPTLEKALKLAGCSLEELDFLSVTKGPGSFTGIRMAVTAAKLLAWGLNIPLVALSSLAVLAHSEPHSGELVLPLIDARGTRVYAALYDEARCVLADDKFEMDELFQKLPRGRTIILTGDGSQKFYDAYSGNDLTFLQSAGPQQGLSAENLGKLAIIEAEAGRFQDPYTLLAHYCSVSQAERLNPHVLQA